MDARKIKMADIHSDDSFNCRGEIPELDVIDLAKDIRDKGLLQPVVVTPYSPAKQKETGKTYLLVAGYRRYRACRICEMTEIDAVIRDGITEVEARVLNLSENLNRKQLDILQEALALKKLYMFHISREEIARSVNMSVGWVQVRLMLLDLPKEVWEEAKAGSINQSDIRTLYSLYNATGNDSSVYEEVKRIKVKKLSGHKPRASKAEKKKADVKSVQTRKEILDMLEYVQQWIPNGLWSRSLAWASGEITNGDFHSSVTEYAEQLGRPYRPPVEAML